jgi:hypothetical protein
VGVSSSQQPSVVSQFERYRAGQHDAVAMELRQIRDWSRFVDDIKRQTDRWPPAAAAAFALEAATLALPPHRVMPIATSDQLVGLGEEAALRPTVAARFLQTWYHAAIAFQEGRAIYTEELPGALGRRFVRRMVERLPSDPVVQLAVARAEAAPFFFWIRTFAINAKNPRPTSSWEARALPAARRLMLDSSKEFERLAQVASIRTEATVRAGYLRLIAEDARVTLRLVESAARDANAESDRWHFYLAQLIRGRALEMLDDRAAAIEAYRAAVQTWPEADSARTPLAAALYLSGAREDAAGIVNGMLGSTARGRDPWIWFPFGDYRHFKERLTALRSQLQ